MTIDRDRLASALEKLHDYKPLSPSSLRRVNDIGMELEGAGESPTTIALSMLGGSLGALTQVASREDIEEIVGAMIHAMYGDVDPEQLEDLHDIQERARQRLADATGVSPAKLPRLPFERS